MGRLGVTEILVILAVVLLLFGGKKIPELMKGLGSGIKEFKNAAKDDQPNGIWHFGFLVPSLEPINAITPVHQGETAPGRHAENYIIDPQGNRIDVVLDMWPT